MPRKTGSSRKPKLVIKQKAPSPEDLEEFIREADEVQGLTSTKGWSILERDLRQLRDGITEKLAYLNPKRPEFYEARLLYIATDKLFALVEDYAANKNIALELLTKLQNPDLAVTLDVDNE